MATGSGKTFTAITSIYRLIKFAGARRVYSWWIAATSATRPSRNSSSTSRPTTTSNSPRNSSSSASAATRSTPPRGSASAPSSACTPCSRARNCRRRRRRLRRRPRVAVQETRTHRLQPGHPHRNLRHHHHRRMPPLHLQPLGAGAGILRRLPHRPHRHAQQADLRLLPPEPGDGIPPRAGRGRRRQRQLRRLPHPHPITEAGSKVEAGYSVQKQERDTRKKRWEQLDDDFAYDPNQLDRDVVAPDQIRTIVRTFRDKLFTEIFPGRTEVPKTLIFAKDDAHAENIVEIVREEFGKGNDFAQKITYRTTGAKPKDLIKPSATATTRASPSPWT